MEIDINELLRQRESETAWEIALTRLMQRAGAELAVEAENRAALDFAINSDLTSCAPG